MHRSGIGMPDHIGKAFLGNQERMPRALAAKRFQRCTHLDFPLQAHTQPVKAMLNPISQTAQRIRQVIAFTVDVVDGHF